MKKVDTNFTKSLKEMKKILENTRCGFYTKYGLWEGKALESYTKSELMDIIVYLSNELEKRRGL